MYSDRAHKNIQSFFVKKPLPGNGYHLFIVQTHVITF